MIISYKIAQNNDHVRRLKMYITKIYENLNSADDAINVIQLLRNRRIEIKYSIVLIIYNLYIAE